MDDDDYFLDALDAPEPGLNESVDHGTFDPEGGHQDQNPVYSTIVDTYHEVWQDFYAWDQWDCSEHLGSLAVSADQIASGDVDYAFQPDSEDVVADGQHDERIEPIDSFTFCEWDVMGQLSKYTVPVKSGATGRRHTRKSNAWFQEHAPYEACTPLNDLVFVNARDALVDCPYIKYGDSPGFNARAYLRQFRSVSWQDPWCDPDQDVIAVATIQQLISWTRDNTGSRLEIFWDDIVAAQIFPHEISTILHRVKLRDLPPWPLLDSAQAVNQLTPLWSPGNGPSTTGRLLGMYYSFCPRLGCVQFECFNDPYPTGWVVGHAESSELDNEAFKAKFAGRRQCGEECFLVKAAGDDTPVRWDEGSNLDLLDELLAIESNAVPCHLSQILNNAIPCYKVFLRRGEKVNAVPSEDSRPRPVPPEWNDFGEIGRYSIPTRCDHDGPCSSRNCACFKNGVHCQRNCLCDISCKLRYDGCDCSKKRHSHMCSSKSKQGACLCAKYGWECNPELCDHTVSKKHQPLLISQDTEIACKNTDLQWKVSPYIEVKTGRYGLGAFANQQIREGQFIGEYVSELFMNGSYYFHAKGPLHDFTGYNYSFILNNSVVADAANVGNEMRYFNHSADEANIEPTIKLVNGDHKIAFYATRRIKKGEEILFDYGERYWHNH